MLAVTDGAGNMLETYTHGADLSGTVGAAAGGIGGIGGILALTQTGGAAYYHYDFNGNVVNVSTSNQTQLAKYTYGPFGEVLLKEGSFDSRYQFSTKELDGSTGMNYFGYRFYHSEFGRWINRDPIGERGGLNLYAFVSNDPIVGYDILGMLGCFDCGEWTNDGEPYWENTGSTPIFGGKNCEYSKYQDKSRPCRFCCIPYTQTGRDELESTSCVTQGGCPDSPDDPDCW